MSNFNYDSYCGIYCGACDIMNTYKTGYKSRLASFWNETAVKKLHKTMGLDYDNTRPFEITCNGCKTDTLFVNCRVCNIRKCAIEKNVAHCIDCGEYPCNTIIEFNKMSSFFPHLNCKQANMEKIKKEGTERWLSEQENGWKCPDCKTGFSWYTGKCNNCGKDLTGLSYKFYFIKSLILKAVIHISSLAGKKHL